MRGENARASASCFFRVPRVRRTVRAEKELRVPAGNGVEKGATIGFSLEYGQAIVMRTDAAGEQRIPIHQQVLRSDRRCDTGACLAHELNRFPRCYVLEHDTQSGMPVD